MRLEQLEKLIELFMRFPGIGARQAARFAYYLVDENKKTRDDLIAAIAALAGIRRCGECFRVLGAGSCAVCADAQRDHSTITILEKDADLAVFERAGVYDGHYFVLGGTLSEFGDGEGASRLRFRKLYERIKTTPSICEVIVATDATPEGNFTARYIEKILEPLQGERAIKISRLGRGMSTGAEIEYLNRDTLKDALDNRR
ncbi:MAG: recombination protein RecR [Candidatus Niyogibacteria bacterium]|nr:recombination protein RecR [Candidatus Niyogibacteria bacterium]